MKQITTQRLKYSAVPVLLFILVLWLVQLLQWGLDASWYEWGILPRTGSGLKGIVFSVFIHRNFSHLLANTPALLILGWFVYYFYKQIANEVMLMIWAGSGILTWIIGRPAYHAGASGLIYGLAFFLFFSGIFRKNTRLAAIALITVFVYGSLLWNMFPIAELVDPTVSWEGHLAGALAGVATAVILRKKGPQPDPVPMDDEDETEDPMEDDAETTFNYPEKGHEEKKAERQDLM